MITMSNELSRPLFSRISNQVYNFAIPVLGLRLALSQLLIKT